MLTYGRALVMPVTASSARTEMLSASCNPNAGFFVRSVFHVLLAAGVILCAWSVISPAAHGQDSSQAVEQLTASSEGEVVDQTVAAVSADDNFGWTSVLPPVIAIVVALIFKRVIPALFLGVWLGGWTVYGFSLVGLLTSLLDSFQVYVLNALADPDHAAVILFSFMIGGMVGIVTRNGGMNGVVNHIARWATSSKRGQIVTATLGLAVFFDDYANTLVVGNTMRPVTDKLRISREKLAYLVDSTAAPVACLALVTTWIGYEVGLIGDAIAKIDGLDLAPYEVFLQSIPYSFYPLLAIFFVFLIAFWHRDFGPMHRAEVRARTTGQVLGADASVDSEAADGEHTTAIEGKPHRAVNAVLPVVVLVVGVMAGLYVTGEGDSVREIIGTADSYKSLMWASLMSVIVAFILSLSQRILTVTQTVEAWYAGLKSMLFAMIILVLAWALSDLTEVLGTANYLMGVLGDTINPGLLPAIVFILAAATAFATGSSWGTMGILMPLVLPLTWAVLAAGDMADPDHYHILYSTVSCVLAGAVWGDHCSPISDTTILSSMASGCDHIEHVRTQLPYALLVGMTAIGLGTIPTGFGFPWWGSLAAGIVVLMIALRLFGKETDLRTGVFTR
ncbi:MAG: Na+/H+ antiporter NhaC family protein [Rhodothermia bacterium]|nr:Na+/H+ antiporter NhaC family protein [Rhodothermia bacterium]